MTQATSSDRDALAAAIPSKSPNWRFAWSSPDQLPSDQRLAYEGIRERRGKVPQPYRALLASPAVAGDFERLAASMWQSGLPAGVLEAIYLAVAARQQCAYQWEAHFPKALEAGVSREQVQQILAHQPLTPDGPVSAAIAFAEELQRNHRVCDSTFERAGQHFGDKGRADLIHAVTVATTISLLLNVQVADD